MYFKEDQKHLRINSETSVDNWSQYMKTSTKQAYQETRENEKQPT